MKQHEGRVSMVATLARLLACINCEVERLGRLIGLVLLVGVLGLVWFARLIGLEKPQMLATLVLLAMLVRLVLLLLLPGMIGMPVSNLISYIKIKRQIYEDA